ncbi:MAG: DUF1707 domain-containing protein [Propioniciclava sp.]
MSSDPVPQRLSDADRDGAADLLREHYTAGRLTATELDERLSTALEARFATDLSPLFADLPVPRPAVLDPDPARLDSPHTHLSTSASTLAPRPPAKLPAGLTQQHLAAVRAVLWPVAIGGAFLTGWWPPFIIIAIVGTIVLQQLGGGRTPPPYNKNPPLR